MHANAVIARRAIGAMFFSVFGCAWLMVWAFHRFPQQTIAFILVGLVFLVLFYFCFQCYLGNRSALADESNDPVRMRTNRMFNIINAIQWVAIFLIINVLNRNGLADWAVPAIILLIGLHFIPLAKIFKYPPHYLTGAGLIIVSIGYPLLALNGPRDFVGCLVTGLILWASALRVIIAQRHNLARKS